MKSIEWIDEFKNAKGNISDYKTAQILGVTRQFISSHRTQRLNTLEDKTCIMIAQELNIDPLAIIADQNLERAKNEEDRDFWRNIFKKANGKYAASALVVALTLNSYFCSSIYGYYVK